MGKNHEEVLSCWTDLNYWRDICPQLGISSGCKEYKNDKNDKDDKNGKNGNDEVMQGLIEEGFVEIDTLLGGSRHESSYERPLLLREAVAQGIRQLVGLLLPATFILLFDEAWELAAESHFSLSSSGQNSKSYNNCCANCGREFTFDVLAWHVEPGSGGFAPHRDRQPDTPEALASSFYEDGRAKFLTHWIALTDATPANSCLYVIPKPLDPGYLAGDHHADPLAAALPHKQAFQHIRALPRFSGQSLLFTHRIIHWGSNATKPPPRIAISFVYSDPQFEHPYLAARPFPTTSSHANTIYQYPPFHIRLLLVCAQLLIYHQRLHIPNLPNDNNNPYQRKTILLRACHHYCNQYSSELHHEYRKKVFVEFVNAMKECQLHKSKFETDNNNNNNNSITNQSHNEDHSTNTNNSNSNNNNINKDNNKKSKNKHTITIDYNKQQNILQQNDQDEDEDDEDAMLEIMLNHQEEFDDDYDDLLLFPKITTEKVTTTKNKSKRKSGRNTKTKRRKKKT